MARNDQSSQPSPIWFRLFAGALLPGLLILIGVHDAVVGENLFVFAGSEFRENVARYALVETAARISGVATIGLGIGFGLRNLAGLLGRQRLWTDRLANPVLVISLLGLLVAHWALPGYVSLAQ